MDVASVGKALYQISMLVAIVCQQQRHRAGRDRLSDVSQKVNSVLNHSFAISSVVYFKQAFGETSSMQA